MSGYLSMLEESGANLMVFRDGDIVFSSTGRGISPLIEVIAGCGVDFSFREETDVVKAKDGVVYCVFERLVWDVSDPEEAYRLIREKLKELS